MFKQLSFSNRRARDIGMLRNLFPSQSSGFSLEETIELVNKRLEDARKENDSAKALELINSAKLLLKDAENIFLSKKVKDRALSESIANAYHEHGTLLDGLGRRGKAKKSQSKAEKWGYVDVVSRDTGSFRPLSDVTDVTQLNNQDHAFHATPAEVNNSKLTPNKDVVQAPQKIFGYNITPPTTKYALPEADQRIASTPQLAYCLSLLHPSMISKEELGQSERDWLQAKDVDPDERERLQTMATDLIRAFVQEGLKKPDVVAEVASLVAILEQDDFRKLLQVFVNGISQSLLLDVHLLNGLAQLIRNAPQG
ncbi:hypothetical protein BGZ80_008091, partial [Entomortierella chlamydospora]